MLLVALPWNGVVIENAIGSSFGDYIEGTHSATSSKVKGAMIRYSEAAAPISSGAVPELIHFYSAKMTSIHTAFLIVLWKTLKLVLIILDHFISRMTSRMNTMIYTTTLRRRVSAVLMRLMDPHLRCAISTMVKRQAQ